MQMCMDKDQNGNLSLEELLMDGLHINSQSVPELEIRMLMEAADTDVNGTLDSDEFVTVSHQDCEHMHDECQHGLDERLAPPLHGQLQQPQPEALQGLVVKADADEADRASGGGGGGIWCIQLLLYPLIININ